MDSAVSAASKTSNPGPAWIRRLLLAAAGLGVAAAVGAGWAFYQRRPPAGMPPIRWRQEVPDLQSRLGTLTRDGVFIGSTGEIVTAWDRDGKVVWNFTNGPSLGSVIEGAQGGFLLGGYRQGTRRLVCLDSQGRFQWDQRAVVIDGIPPTVLLGGNIVTSGTDRELHAFSPSGKPLWNVEIQSSSYGPPLQLSDGALITLGPTPGPGLVVVGADGRPKGPFCTQRFNQEPSLRLATVARDDTVYLAGNGGEFLRALSRGGSLRWTLSLDLDATSKPSVTPTGTLVLTGRNPKTEAFELVAVSDAGAVLWRRTLGLPYADLPPVIAEDGSIYLTTGEPALWCVERGGEIRWKYRMPRPIQWAPPARKSVAAWTTFLRQLLRTPRNIPRTPVWISADGSLRAGLGGAQGYLLCIERPSGSARP